MTLDEWMTERQMVDGDLAASLGVSREYVRLLRAGRRNPSQTVMDAITALTHGAVARNDMDAAIEARQQKELARGQRTVDAVYDV